MSINISRAGSRGFSLIEVMISSAITSLLFLALGTFAIYGARILAAMGNYVEVESSSRLAVDILSKQIRQSKALLAFSTNSITVQDGDGSSVQFSYDSAQKTLKRVKNRVSQVLLTGCQSVAFQMFQRTAVNGSFGAYPTTSLDAGKMLQVTWVCSRDGANGTLNSDCVQSAKIVIRKRQK